jgi:two-component system NtrC family sensor kinase
MSCAKLPPLINTERERCHVCYTCVRECPGKAIRIAAGQAEIITDRCIGCGNCVQVCSRGAKQARTSLPTVEALLASEHPVAAIVAPSFPAEFLNIEPERFVGLLRRLGFDLVSEVAFGADLVARQYADLLKRDDQSWIATTCPAIVGFVERYHPELVPQLAPIVSPMVASARVLREQHGAELRVVFIGPCIAKKAEARGEVASSGSRVGEVEAALTFLELRQLLVERGLFAAEIEPSSFDPPLADLGALFPIAGGMLQAARIDEDLLAGDVVATDGRQRFIEALREFEHGDLDARLLEVLACEGCIMGPGMSAKHALFRRRAAVSRYVRESLGGRDREDLARQRERFANVDLTCEHHAADQRVPPPPDAELTRIMAGMGRTSVEDELNCGACGYDTCRDHAAAIFKGLAEPEMCLPHNIEKLRSALGELAISHEELKSAQEQLMQSEKMASMGQMAAGIAHEVNNPLGVVLMYSHLVLDDLAEDTPLREDLQLIATQAERCRRIVGGLLNFARQDRVSRQQIDASALFARARDGLQLPAEIVIEEGLELDDRWASVDADQLTQVLANLISNACEAMGGQGKLQLRTHGDDTNVKFSVADTGPGIDEGLQKKIFEPFFTTKPIGKGTGLGLAVSYGIVKMHRGDILVQSNTDPQHGPTGTTITVSVPRAAPDTASEADPAAAAG